MRSYPPTSQPFSPVIADEEVVSWGTPLKFFAFFATFLFSLFSLLLLSLRVLLAGKSISLFFSCCSAWMRTSQTVFFSHFFVFSGFFFVRTTYKYIVRTSSVLFCPYMRRPGCFCGPWSSWHLQVASLSRKPWTSLCDSVTRMLFNYSLLTRATGGGSLPWSEVPCTWYIIWN